MAASDSQVPFWNWKNFQKWLITLRDDPERSEGYLLALAVVVGIVMGVVSTLFRWLIERSHYLFHGSRDDQGQIVSESVLHYLPMGMEGPVKIFLPALGGLFVGLLIYKVLRLSGGHGVSSVMKAVSTGEVYLAPTMAIKSLTSPITIASGGSSGPEGPIVEIGSVIGSLIGRYSRIRHEHVGTLLGCGAAAGIAGVFAAPIGGVFFAMELIMRDFDAKKLVHVGMAAVVAAVTSTALLPNDPVFPPLTKELLDTVQPSLVQVLQFSILGVFCALVGALLIRSLYKFHDLFHSLKKVPMWLKPMVGGILVGVIGIGFPDILGEGYESVNNMIYNNAITEVQPSFLSLLFVLCLLKIVATSLTLGSGGTGGTFAPAMVSGALVGAALGCVFTALFPGHSPDYRIFASVGMAGLVSSALGTPLAAMMIIFEVSGGHYSLLVPLLVTVTISSMVSKLLSQGSVYTMTLLRDGFDLDEFDRRKNDPLSTMLVEELMTGNYHSFRPNDTLDVILEALANTDEEAFAVCHETGTLHGIISTHDLRSVATLGDLGAASLIAADLANSHMEILTPKSPAMKAMEIFSSSQADGIAVLDNEESRQVVGMIYRSTMLKAYSYGGDNE